MAILAIETSSVTGSLCLIEDGDAFRIIEEIEWTKGRSHSELITTKLLELLNNAQLKLEDIKKICVSRGPGSFTGIRVGISLARSLAYVHQLPLLGMDSLSLMASAYPSQSKILCLIGAFRNLIYMALFEKQNNDLKNIIEPQCLTASEISSLINSPCHVIGRPYIEFSDDFSNDFKSLVCHRTDYPDLPHANHFCSALKSHLKTNTWTTWPEVIPLYIRASEAEEKLRRGLLKPSPK